MPLDANSPRSAKSHEIFHSRKDKDVEDQVLSSFPAHVNMVKDGLLDFNHFLGLGATMLVLGDGKSGDGDGDTIPLYAYKTDGLKASQRAREREFLENARELAEGAQRLEIEFAQDGGEWRTLFRNVVTNRKDDIHYFGSHQPSTIAYAENELWDTDLDPSRSSHTNPKPDLYFGFPIHNAEYRKLAVRNDLSLPNFTVDTLFQLAMKGLRCIPVSSSLTSVAGMKRDSTEQQVPLLCFPWCIIQLKGAEKVAEIKENDDSALETIYKASIAATGALAMLETLARFADVKQDGQHIPPVIAITSVGPNTTVWLAYSEIIDDQYRDHMMVSIWNGCITKIWDAIQFCRIMDNLIFWSQYILRPKVLHYIDQWRLRYGAEAHNLHSRLEKDLETAELVHQIQDRLSSLGISPTSNLPKLIQQAVILREVTRSNIRKTEPAPKQGLNPNAQAEIKISQRIPSLQSKPPKKNAAVLADLPVSGEKSASRDSIATENKLATPSKRPLTSEHVSKSEPPTDSSSDEKQNREPFFSYPYKFKTSDFEFDQRRFLSHSPKSKSACFKEPTASKDLASRKDSNNWSRSADTSSAPPNPFVAKFFELSFHVKYWWCELPIEARWRGAGRESEPYSTLNIDSTSSSREYEVDDLGRTVRSEPPKKSKLGGLPAEIPKPPLSKVRIPWKGDRFITVRLPPVTQVSPPKSRPDPFIPR